MPGVDTFTDGYGVTFNAYWERSPAEVPQAHQMAGWMGELRAQYGPFRPGLRQVDAWSNLRPDILQTRENGRIANDNGLTYSDGVILMNARAANPGCLSHEVGHWNEAGFIDDPDEHARRLRGLWWNLRGWESTAATPPGERWAEDWRDLFGCSGVRGTTSPGDDGQRKPWDVLGLRSLMLAMPAVLALWRRFGWISDARMQGDEVWWVRRQWFFFPRWERWRAGQFEYWGGADWVPFNP